MTDMIKKINEIIEKNRDEMIKTLKELIAIPSVVSEAEGDMPFGRNVQDAFMYMLDKGGSEGFSTVNTDNYGGHIEFDSGKDDQNEILGIVGHIDVVPEGDNWDYPPFSGEIHGSRMYGRGTSDDKGPVVASFYAMKALKEAGFVPSKKIRLILGNDEETNWYGMKYYLAHEKEPDFAFTPDSEFPAIQGEMGVLFFDIVKKIGKSSDRGLELRSLKGGNAPNMVPDYARAVVNAENREIYKEIKELACEVRETEKKDISCRGTGKSLEIVVRGKSAHGSTPEKGENAISIMMEFLGNLKFVNDDTDDFIAFYNTCIGKELDGESLGIGMSDEKSGKLILNVGMIEADPEKIMVTVNVRYPVTKTSEEVYSGMQPLLDEHDLGVVKKKDEKPIYVSSDDELIVTLMDVYRKHTGDTESMPVVAAGATYARAFKKCIAFGAEFQGEESTMHQKNEYIALDNLMKITKIYAESIYLLTKQDEE